MFSSTFYNKLDPKYREKLMQIEKTFETAKPFFDSSQASSPHLNQNLRSCQKAIRNFYNQYMMPKELWDIILKMRDDYPFHNMNLLKLSEYQFQSTDTSSKKLYNYRCDMDTPCDVENFRYPHFNMEKCFENFERERYSFVPKSVLRQFERMKLQYDKIKSVEEDDEKWVEAIMEVNDDEFIEHNIEFRFGKDLTNKNLWKKYLDYLKSHDQQKLLQTYSKYCRFFLDDIEMLKEYRMAAGDQKVCVPWKNAFNFEVFDRKFYCQRREYKKNNSVAPKLPLKCHCNAENTLNQRFPFRSTLMNYVIKNANAFVLYDLFKSCKWFYLKNPVTICYTFEAGRSTHIKIQDQFISVPDYLPMSPLFEKLFISTNLFIDESFLCSNNLIPRIYRCTAKFVDLRDQKFTDEELQILIGHGNVIYLNFNAVKTLNNEYFKLETILEMVPKINSIHIISIQCTPETSQKLLEMSFKNKIYELCFYCIENNFLEPKLFAEFVNKNVSPSGFVHMCFNSKVDADFTKNFKTITKDAINDYWNTKDKPDFVFL